MKFCNSLLNGEPKLKNDRIILRLYSKVTYFKKELEWWFYYVFEALRSSFWKKTPRHWRSVEAWAELRSRLKMRHIQKLANSKKIHNFCAKGPFILLCQIISVECPTNFIPCFILIGCLGLPLLWLDVSSGKFKFVGHSTEIIQQREIKGPLPIFKDN